MQMFRIIALLILAGLATSSRRAHAMGSETMPSGVKRTQPNVEDLVRQALARSPSLAAARARQAAAHEQVSPAGALPDPVIGVMYQSIGPPWQPMAPMSMVQVEVSQSIPGVGKRAARRAAAEAQADERSHQVRTMRARLAVDVRRTYANIYVIDHEHEALEAAKNLANVLLTSVVGRYTSGQLDQEALVKAQLEISGLDERLADHDVERHVLVATLNDLTAQPEATDLPKLESLPDVTVSDITAIARIARERAPELHAQRAAIGSASRRIDSAEKDSRPNFLVGLAGGSTTGGDPVVVLRFGMELPVWSGSKQQPLVRAARNDLEAAEDDLRVAEFQVREQVERLTAQWQRDTEQVQRYREMIVPQSNVALRAAQASYAAGRADFGTLVEDFRRWLDAQVNLIRREADRYVTWAELQTFLNAEP